VSILLAATKRLKIVHRTGFRYDGTVAASYNEARMTPMNTRAQTVLAARVTVEPVTWTFSYKDYWDTQVTAFDVLVPHSELAVISSSTVEVHVPGPTSAGIGWPALSEAETTDTTAEFMPQTASTTPHEEVVDLAQEAASGLAPDSAAHAVCERLRAELEYVPGSTAVTTDAREVWVDRRGVCQDFAHLAVGCLRAAGLPARYVSGYLETAPPAGRERLRGSDASHAWASVLVPGGAWVDLDPTNDHLTDARYVTTGWGRDFGDVSPLKGVIFTESTRSRLEVAVDVQRMADGLPL
jgi:transglutaminase-like putative cysteine protease